MGFTLQNTKAQKKTTLAPNQQDALIDAGSSIE